MISDTVNQGRNLGFEVIEILHVQGEMAVDVSGAATATRLTKQHAPLHRCTALGWMCA